MTTTPDAGQDVPIDLRRALRDVGPHSSGPPSPAPFPHPHQRQACGDAAQESRASEKIDGADAWGLGRCGGRDDDRTRHLVTELGHLVRNQVRCSRGGLRRIGANRHRDGVGGSLDLRADGRSKVLDVDAGLRRDIMELRRTRREGDEAGGRQADAVGTGESRGSRGNDRRDGGRLVLRRPQSRHQRSGEQAGPHVAVAADVVLATECLTLGALPRSPSLRHGGSEMSDDPTVEAVSRLLATELLARLPHGRGVVLVTAVRKGAGTSTVAEVLAFAAALVGRKVALVRVPEQRSGDRREDEGTPSGLGERHHGIRLPIATRCGAARLDARTAAVRTRSTRSPAEATSTPQSASPAASRRHRPSRIGGASITAMSKPGLSVDAFGGPRRARGRGRRIPSSSALRCTGRRCGVRPRLMLGGARRHGDIARSHARELRSRRAASRSHRDRRVA
jgi:hypothetical protein